MSENLKKVILDKARQFTDQKISIQKVHVNPIPFFLELNDISVAKPGGKAWFNTEKVKIYVDIVELFREKLEIRRMLVSGANVKLNRDTMALIGALSGRDSDGDGMILRTIDVRKSNISYEDRDLRINANGVNLSAILKAVPELSLNVGQIDYKSEMLSLTDIGVRGRLQIDSDIITMESITIVSGQSSVKAKGIIYTESREFLSSIKGDITINDFGRVLNMDLKRDGNIRASGKIEYLNGELFSETSLSGSFFLESLMSFLDLNEPLRGMTQFSGKLKVDSDEIYAHANARWINGHVHGVDIDSATCDVTYSSDDNKLRFSNGKGALYGGTADADVYITLPSVDTFMVNVKAYDVDAKDLLSLINFDLDPSTGKVTGEVVSEGEQFLPEGWFDATFETSEGNILKRINRAQGKYRSVGSNMILENLNLETAESNMIINGSYHMDTETLDLHGHANTENLSDAVDPYYVGVSGSGSAMFEVTGTTESPVIKAGVRASDVSVHDFMYDDLEASFSYQKARLQVSSLIVSKGSEHHSCK
jgi:translocation and assembly module TamB